MDQRITIAQIGPVRDVLQSRQGGKCLLCGGTFHGAGAKTPALDHDHITGSIRDVLCIWCNSREGKVFNLARTAKKADPLGWLKLLVEYLEKHKVSQHKLRHPTHKTESEKRVIRNKKARKARAARRET